MDAKLQDFLNKMRDIQMHLLHFIESDSNIEENFQNFVKYLGDQKIPEDPQNFKLILHLINSISNHHHRTPHFFDKFEKLLINYKSEIKQFLTNFQIFHIFKKNKRILFFLIKEQILTIDRTIASYISKENRELFYCDYLSTELYPFHSILLLVNDFEKVDDEKREIGENDSKICEIIRKDSINEFVEYIKKNNMSPNSTISYSKYETNPFLNLQEPSLIEYAAFFGSFQIFEFLYKNGVELKSSLWNFAIHGNNLNLLNILKDKKVPPEYDFFWFSLKEAMKCHHIEVANFIKQNFVPEYDELFTDDSLGYMDNFLIYCFRYYNFAVWPNNFLNKFTFLYACNFDYYSLVEILLNEQKVDLNSTIGANCFKNCKNLAEIDIPSTITILGDNAFSGCASLNKITIPSSVIEIRKNCFERCSSLSNVSIPSSVKKIGKNAFNGCSSLTSISVPDGVTIIDNFTFASCSSLEKIDIPSSVTTLGNGVFEECSSLQTIKLLDSLKKIGKSVFKGCLSLTTINIPKLIDSLPDETFSECESLEEVLLPQGLATIGSNSFFNCVSIEKITLPSSITSIGDSSFSQCKSLKSFDIPSSVIKIGKSAFYDCSSLKQIKIPSSVVSIGPSAFQKCSSLLQVELPNSIEEIDWSLFEDCTALWQVSIPDSVKVIGSSAFRGCSALMQIVIPSSVKKIDKGAFRGCSSLTKITIPHSVTSLGSAVFSLCTSLICVEIPSSLNSKNLGLPADFNIIKT